MYNFKIALNLWTNFKLVRENWASVKPAHEIQWEKEWEYKNIGMDHVTVVGGHYWNYSADTLSLLQVIATRLKIGYPQMKSTSTGGVSKTCKSS